MGHPCMDKEGKSPGYSYPYMRIMAENLNIVNYKLSLNFLRDVGCLDMEFTRWLIKNKQFIRVTPFNNIH